MTNTQCLVAVLPKPTLTLNSSNLMTATVEIERLLVKSKHDITFGNETPNKNLLFEWDLKISVKEGLMTSLWFLTHYICYYLITGHVKMLLIICYFNTQNILLLCFYTVVQWLVLSCHREGALGFFQSQGTSPPAAESEEACGQSCISRYVNEQSQIHIPSCVQCFFLTCINKNCRDKVITFLVSICTLAVTFIAMQENATKCFA